MLERRDTPAIPGGLTDISGLLVGASVPAGYAETHAVVRSESHTATVDQVGSGSEGTFTIDVVGSAGSSDDAGGEGESGTFPVNRVEATGGGSNSLSYHLVLGGTYANGTFTVTTETYTETGSRSLSQSVTNTAIYPGSGWLANSWDTSRSGSYSLSYTAEVDAQGVLAYTSYTYDSTESADWHQRSEYSFGGYTDTVSSSGSSGRIEWDGTAATRTGSRSWSTGTQWGYPGASGSTSDGWTEPVSDTVSLPWLGRSTGDWVWRAGAWNATDFTYHGVTEESAELTETARYTSPDGSSWQFDVLDFDVTARSSISGHTVDDEPGVAESGTGTTLFHRDELFSAADDVTGSGSYVGGSADATYEAVQTATFTASNVDTVLGSHSSGIDDEGEPFDLVFNATNAIGGGGTVVITNTYHDAGPGPELTGLTITQSSSSVLSSQSWGEYNGIAFGTSSTTTDASAASESYPTNPGPLVNPEGLSRTAPYRGFVIPHQQFYVQQPTPGPLPGTPVRPRVPDVQGWYNEQIRRIGENAERKVTRDVYIRSELRRQIENDPRRGAGRAFSSGQFQSESPQSFALGVGRSDELLRAQRRWQELLGRNGATAELAPQNGVVCNLTYGFNQPTQDERSGQIAVQYVFVFTFRVTRADGTTYLATGREGIRGSILLQEDWAKTIPLQP